MINVTNKVWNFQTEAHIKHVSPDLLFLNTKGYTQLILLLVLLMK